MTVTGVVIILAVLGFAVYGVKTGLVNSVFGLCSIFFTTVFTWLLYPWISGLVMKTSIYTWIYDWSLQALSGNEQLAQSTPDFLVNLPAFLRSAVESFAAETAGSMQEYCARGLAALAINAICIVVLFVGIRLLLSLAKKLGKQINKIIIIGPINTILGGAFGVAQGLALVYLVMMIVSYLPATKVYETVKNDLQVSYVGQLLFREDMNIFGFEPRYPQ